MQYALVAVDGDVEVIVSEEPTIEIDIISAHVAGEDETDATFSAVFGEDVSLYFNDNGKIIGLPVNPVATRFAHTHQLIALEDFLVGNVLVFGGVDHVGWDKPVEDSAVEELRN